MIKSLLLTLAILFSNLIFGQNAQEIRLDSLFSALHKRDAFNGNVLIADKGKVVFQKSYGLANEETKQKLNLETKFELASVSKQFTAMGIVLLEKAGKLKYDDKISKYIPQLDFYGDITIRNLLNHTAGLPDYMELFEENWDQSKFATNQDIVNEFAKHKPKAVFQPNEKFEYSNTGYALLALIIEKVSKKSFGDFLSSSIFKPLKMTNTFVYRSRFQPRKVDNYAFGYVQDSLGKKVLTNSFGKDFYTYYLDGIVGDGMVNSTIGDLLKWDRALYSNTLVNEKDKDLIFSSPVTKDGQNGNYGFGWSVNDNKKYGKIANHSGGWAGYTTFIERQLANDKTIILLQNNSLPATNLPVREVRNIIYNEPIVSDTPIQLKSEDLDKYLGVYSAENFPLKITISKKDVVLYAQATGQGEFPMISYKDHTFKFEPANIKIVFNIAENNFEMTQSGMKVLLKKE